MFDSSLDRILLFFPKNYDKSLVIMRQNNIKNFQIKTIQFCKENT